MTRRKTNKFEHKSSSKDIIIIANGNIIKNKCSNQAKDTVCIRDCQPSILKRGQQCNIFIIAMHWKSAYKRSRIQLKAEGGSRYAWETVLRQGEPDPCFLSTWHCTSRPPPVSSPPPSTSPPQAPIEPSSLLVSTLPSRSPILLLPQISLRNSFKVQLIIHMSFMCLLASWRFVCLFVRSFACNQDSLTSHQFLALPMPAFGQSFTRGDYFELASS